MGIARETSWQCDICEKEEVIGSKTTNGGLHSPDGWVIASIYVKIEDERYTYPRDVIVCGECYKEYYNLSPSKESTEKVMRKPFWKRLLRREYENTKP